MLKDDYYKAELLWLYYDYKTEKYDKKLPNSYPNKHDEGLFVPYGESRKLSYRHARNMKRKIKNIAEFYEIPINILKEAEKDHYRMSSSTNLRIKEFEELKEQGELDFIYDYFDYVKSLNLRGDKD